MIAFGGRRGPHRSGSRCRGRPIERREAGREGCLWPNAASQGQPPDGSGGESERSTQNGRAKTFGGGGGGGGGSNSELRQAGFPESGEVPFPNNYHVVLNQQGCFRCDGTRTAAAPRDNRNGNGEGGGGRDGGSGLQLGWQASQAPFQYSAVPRVVDPIDEQFGGGGEPGRVHDAAVPRRHVTSGGGGGDAQRGAHLF